jgi:hypothetical protein
MPSLPGRLFTSFKTHQFPCKHVYKSFAIYKKTLAHVQLQGANILKVLIYLTWCLRCNLD